MSRAGSGTVAFDGNLLAVDKAWWGQQGLSWHMVTKLRALQPSGRQKLGLSAGANAWIVFLADPGFAAKLNDWLVDLAENPPELEDKNARIAVVVTADASVYVLTGWYSLVRVELLPFAAGDGHEAVLGAMLGGAKAPMALALIARRSGWVSAGIDYVNIESGDFGKIQFDLRMSEQKS